MKKILFLGLLLAGLLLIIGCVPPSEETKTNEELFLEETSEGAVAGQAIQLGTCPQTRPAASCDAMDDGSYKVVYRQRSRDVTRIIRNSCGVSGRNRAFQVLGCSATGLDYCNYQCETGETCENGFCITAEVPACTDTDNGLDMAVRGTATGTLSIAMPGLGRRGDQVNVTDQCLGSNLREWGCDATGYITHRIGPCAAGQTCREGACVSTSTFCYYLDRNGNRLPAGTGYYDVFHYNLSNADNHYVFYGIETEEGLFNPVCTPRSANLVYVCGGWEDGFRSGDGVRRYSGTIEGRFCYECSDSGDCCGNAPNSVSSFICEGNIVSTTNNYPSCGPTGTIVTNTLDCSTVLGRVTGVPSVCATRLRSSYPYCHEPCTPGERFVSCNVNTTSMVNNWICDSDGLGWSNEDSISCPAGTTCTDPDGPTGATPAACS